MEPRSSALFRSNIYPTTTKGELANDRAFLDAISDPEALDILWRYNGSQGAKLNPLQKRQHDMARHCMYAEEGAFPWGTPVGGDRVVCLCERTDCPLYARECSKFHPEGFVPVSGRDRAPERPELKVSKAKSVTKPRSRPKPKQSPIARSATGTRGAGMPTFGARETAKQSSATQGAKRNVWTTAASSTSRGSSGRVAVNRRPWTQLEDEILIEMYTIFGMSLNRWNKQLRGRSPAEILERAHELNVRYVPGRAPKIENGESRRNDGPSQRPRRIHSPRPSLGRNTSFNRSTGTSTQNQNSTQEKAAKKAHREAMRKRPWDTAEDAILRRMYPIYGADMIRWTEKLKYRTKSAIEARARRLGL